VLKELREKVDKPLAGCFQRKFGVIKGGKEKKAAIERKEMFSHST